MFSSLHQHQHVQSNVKPGFYTIELNKSIWVIPECYQKCLLFKLQLQILISVTPVGTGAYGTVWCDIINLSLKLFDFSAAECITTGDRVAIKKFTRPFQSPIHAKRTHRELRLLRLMNHENVIDLYDVFTPDRDACSLNDV